MQNICRAHDEIPDAISFSCIFHSRESFTFLENLSSNFFILDLAPPSSFPLEEFSLYEYYRIRTQVVEKPICSGIREDFKSVCGPRLTNVISGRKDLGGTLIRAVTGDFEPYSKVDPETGKATKGIVPDVLRILSRKLNFTLKLTEMETVWGSEMANGSWSGMVGKD